MLEAEFPALLRAAAGGDQAAFAQLWRDTHPPLLRYLRVVARDASDDVASDVWLEVARGLARFRGEEQEFRGWVFTLARRQDRQQDRRDGGQGHKATHHRKTTPNGNAHLKSRQAHPQSHHAHPPGAAKGRHIPRHRV